MADVLTTEQKEELAEIISIFISLPDDDRAVLLANANAFRVRSELEKKGGES